MKDYQEELARSTLITVFSYFESYIGDALFEIVNFHGGRDDFWARSKSRTAGFLAAQDADTIKNKRKIQDNPEKHKLAKYQKYARLLDKDGFRFPTELFAVLGLRLFLDKVEQKNGKTGRNGMKAHEIPYLLEDGLLFPLVAKDKSLFEEARTLRNRIGHGNTQFMRDRIGPSPFDPALEADYLDALRSDRHKQGVLDELEALYEEVADFKTRREILEVATSHHLSYGAEEEDREGDLDE